MQLDVGEHRRDNSRINEHINKYQPDEELNVQVNQFINLIIIKQSEQSAS